MIQFKLPPIRIALFVVTLLILIQTAGATVAFTLSPSSVSNTYTGTIQLRVTGLSTGETVVVQKYLDANNNGVVDSADYLAQQLQLRRACYGSQFEYSHGVVRLDHNHETECADSQRSRQSRVAVSIFARRSLQPKLHCSGLHQSGFLEFPVCHQ
jgi:hypothetical protein